ncbi:uncharacterized protein TRAVEDRAFT_50679 [Trametes versicolor FP-101664 SS1]|uniref:uncharacterized protein n=1 Tax=Trametes versicolor (strain FP-101664) TaxID=717944 RepID=UPI00046232E7|nr:uncharacterized protein TRAVEDRAFT_50679 [Trametes versicolor FP-101664 SS1]EIW56197.1 hypothetical protein TRAVEDRAFT_50679 [Trametes versicolor FP-101664 SS1]
MEESAKDVAPKRPTIFLSNRLLSAAAYVRQGNLVPIDCTTADDVESFYWVILYAVYRHGLETLKARKSDKARSRLDDEFSKIFWARDVGTLVDQRVVAFNLNPMGRSNYDGIHVLLDHLNDEDPQPALRTLVAGIWQKLRLCPFKEEPLRNTYADLDKEVVEVNHGFNNRRKALGRAVLPIQGTVPGNAGWYTDDHDFLIYVLENMIDELEAESAS